MMKHKLTRLLSAVIAAIMLMAFAQGANITPLAGNDFDAKIAELEEKAEQIEKENKKREEKIESIKDKIDEKNQYINEVNSQIAAVNEQMNIYNELINAKMEAISAKQLEIENLENEIGLKEMLVTLKEKKITILEEENKVNLKKFGQIMKQMYINSDSDYISLLMGSTDFYDLLVRTEILKNVSESNLEFMNGLLDAISAQEESIKELENEEEQLKADIKRCETQKRKLEDEMAQLDAEKATVTDEANRQYNKLAGYIQDRDELKDQQQNLRNLVNATNEEVEEINALIAELIREKQRGDRPDYSSDGFIWPLDQNYKMITCAFGWDSWRGGMHYGTDIGNAGISGANIYAMQSGEVIIAHSDGGWHGGYGNYVVVDHGGGVTTLYAHCSSTVVSVGQTVNQGDIVGRVGSTGWATGPHLHFEVRINGTAVNAMQYF